MNYFLDTNLIIDAIDRKEPEALSKLTSILEDEDSEIFVNRLVYLETLRIVKLSDHKKFDELKEIFDSFKFVDITPSIYEQAISLSRYCRSKGVTIKGQDTCAAIDFLHFFTAKHYGLELLAKDRDMNRLTENYPHWLTTIEPK